MKIGCVYPQNELGGSPVALDAIGRAVEDLGFDHLLMYDHVISARLEGRDPPLEGPYQERDPFHDPFVAFGYLAGITKRIEFFTGVLILPQRQTPIVAKQATDVDLLSNQRLTLGVSVGWNPVEYETLGFDFHARGKRLDEQIPYLRKLWSEEVIEWQGAFESIDRANICPRPGRQIPIYCGGFAKPAFRRAAKIADGFIFGGQPAAGLVADWQALQSMLRDESREVKDFGAHVLLMTRQFGAQTIQEAADSIRIWQDAGGTGASIVSTGKGYAEAAQHIDFFAEVLAKAG